MVRWLSGYETRLLLGVRVKIANFSRIKTASGREGCACGAPLRRLGRMSFVRLSGRGCRETNECGPAKRTAPCNDVDLAENIIVVISLTETA